jgi:phenylacetyl-CoA:acceptor oxidoreductase
VPIRPKTDAAVLFALLHVILHEQDWQQVCDIAFLQRFTNAPYLVGPDGYYLRDPASLKPLVWDTAANRAVPFDTPDVRQYGLAGPYRVSGVETGPDETRWVHQHMHCVPAFRLLKDHVEPYTPEWAATIADIPADTIRWIAREYLSNACVGATIEVEGEQLPHRQPVRPRRSLRRT